MRLPCSQVGPGYSWILVTLKPSLVLGCWELDPAKSPNHPDGFFLSPSPCIPPSKKPPRLPGVAGSGWRWANCDRQKKASYGSQTEDYDCPKLRTNEARSQCTCTESGQSPSKKPSRLPRRSRCRVFMCELRTPKKEPRWLTVSGLRLPKAQNQRDTQTVYLH